MSLFGSIRIAANTLRADTIAMQVIGQNIANANTPGYIREEVLLTPAPTQRMGRLLLGLGVDVQAVVQKIDLFLEERLRGSVSDKVSSETRESAYTQLEHLVGELSETDVSTAMTNFFNSISEILNQPENVSVRNLAMLNGKTLTEEVRRLADRVTGLRKDVNERVLKMSDDMNRLIEQIRQLNVRIVETEGGDISESDAVGLRDQRLSALEDLSKLVNIRVQEQKSGAVTVYVGGDYLVAEGMKHEVMTTLSSDRGLTVAEIHLAKTDSPLEATGGELQGLMVARDQILGGFMDGLDHFASNLAFEFNKIYSGGQGLHGFRELTSQGFVTDAEKPLNAAGLKHEPKNGSFQVLVYDTESKTTHTTDVFVNLNGVDPDQQTTLITLRDAINAISGGPLTATITPNGQLSIESASPVNEFAFANDTSGTLAALGINTFFTGSTASDLQVNADVVEDPSKFAASRGGVAADTGNAVELGKFLDRPIESENGDSISVMYDRMIGSMTEGSTVTHAAAEGARVFEQTLRGQKLALSGVSIDEEAVRLIAFQKSFQAAARYIETLNECFDMLVKI